MEIWAHRLRPTPFDFGNSLAGLRMLKQMGIGGVEADISFTTDKEIIIYHPGAMKPDLTTLTWQEITSIRFPVMNLTDLLEFMITDKPGMKCCLDIKQNSKELVKKTVELITLHGLEDEIYLTAFQKRIPALGLESGKELLEYAKEICPEIQTHIIAIWPNNLTKLARKHRPDMISLGWLLEPLPVKLISKTVFQLMTLTVDLKSQIEDVKEMKETGIKVLGGIVNDPDDMTYFAELGVDGIMTDNPNLALELKRKRII